jgi:hypothetical protein
MATEMCKAEVSQYKYIRWKRALAIRTRALGSIHDMEDIGGAITLSLV